MYHVNAYYDVIDDFITIYNNLKMALVSLIYIINDVIMCSDVKHFPLFISKQNFIYSATILDINEDYLLKTGEVITFCNGIIYYETPCMFFKTISGIDVH